MPPDFLCGHFRPLRDARLRRGSEPGRLRAIMRKSCVEERGRLLQMPITLPLLEMIQWLPRPPLAGDELHLVPGWGDAAIIGNVAEEDAAKGFLLPKPPGLAIDIGAGY